VAIKFGVIGSGSWATALVKVLTDNRHPLNWWVRNEESSRYIQKRHHNPHYLTSATFDANLLNIQKDVREVVNNSDILIMVVPSAFAADALSSLTPEDWKGKKVLSAIKGILPEHNTLLNDYMAKHFDFSLKNYFAVLGPCHAEEVASQKLSYLTFSGLDKETTKDIASHFKSSYINTVVNDDILGVQYAAVLKNIYALGAGIAHGLDYGDNFQSVYTANSAEEMAVFLRKVGAAHIVVGEHENIDNINPTSTSYTASVYLGDLLVTCYSLYSRNRTFGTMIGKGYSVQAAKLEMSMVAEGYNASKCIYNINQNVKAEMPIAETIFKILWEELLPAEGFEIIEKVMV
jgi:glycerol-3-phosphate dehydrogenase (NAD(P)+)